MKDILLVEDTLTQALKLRHLIERCGFTVEDYRTPLQALKALQNPDGARCKVILSDVNMPEMDGFELCRHIKADPRLAHIPVALLLSLQSLDELLDVLDSGADGFICKIFDLQYMKESLTDLMLVPTASEFQHADQQCLSLEFSSADKILKTKAQPMSVRRLVNLLSSAFRTAAFRSNNNTESQ